MLVRLYILVSDRSQLHQGTLYRQLSISKFKQSAPTETVDFFYLFLKTFLIEFYSCVRSPKPVHNLPMIQHTVVRIKWFSLNSKPLNHRALSQCHFNTHLQTGQEEEIKFLSVNCYFMTIQTNFFTSIHVPWSIMTLKIHNKIKDTISKCRDKPHSSRKGRVLQII